MCARKNTFCYDFVGSGARRNRYRLRKLFAATVQRKKIAGRNAYLRRAPIKNGVIRYYRRNIYGNIQLPPIILRNKKYRGPIMRRPRFKKIFLGARPSERYTGEVNFSDLYIFRKSISMIKKMAVDLYPKRSLLDLLHNDARGVLMKYIDNELKIKILNYIKAFYCFLKYTDTGIYIRSFQKRNYGFADINNLDDTWLKGWEYEIIDEIWSTIWRSIAEFRQVNFIIENGITLPGTIPLRRIWRNAKGVVADECIKQIVRYLIEETFEPCYWNFIYAFIF